MIEEDLERIAEENERRTERQWFRNKLRNLKYRIEVRKWIGECIEALRAAKKELQDLIRR